jgi:60 kDa SS-A/Ro ribonucleoprotein
MADPYTAVNIRSTPQSQQADPRQVKNNAGGYVFQISDEAQLRRFLNLGVSGGTYYVTEAELTRQNAEVVLRAAQENGQRLVDLIVEISTAGRAPRQNPGLFALAAVAGLGDDVARKAALNAIPAVCRTGTTLFQFATYIGQFRGWGRGLADGIRAWYLDKDVDQLAYQMVKYRSRNGWTHRDLLRKVRPKPRDEVQNALFAWACGRDISGLEPGLIKAFQDVQQFDTVPALLGVIADHPLPWEALPDEALKHPQVWMELIRKGMPQTALMRQLPRLTRLGVLDDGETLNMVTNQLASPARLEKARVHPINVLVAQRTYAAGQGTSSSWTPNRKVVDALDAAFYAAYGTVEPAGKRTLYALDVSGSMGSGVMGPGSGRSSRYAVSPGTLSCREAAAALALVTLASEPQVEVVGFTGGGGGGVGWGYRSNTVIQPLDISPRRRLDDVVAYTAGLNFGATDCALPMVWAKENRKDFDTICVVTDNETWAGSVHPHQALRQYRDQVGHDVKYVVAGLASTGFSIADPNDPSSLDIVGLDSAVPNLIADFSRGSL